MNTDNLTSEFKEKAQGKTPEEMLALAQEEGVELSIEQLDQISGGSSWSGKEERYVDCPKCGRRIPTDGFTGSEFKVVCDQCLHAFLVSRSD